MKFRIALGLVFCAVGSLTARPGWAQQEKAEMKVRGDDSVSLPVDVVYCVDNAQYQRLADYEEIQEFIAANVEAFSKFSAPGDLRVGRINYGIVPKEDGKDYEITPLNPDLQSVQGPLEPNFEPTRQPEIVDKIFKLAAQDFRWRPEAYKVLYLVRNHGRLGNLGAGLSALTEKGIRINTVIAAPLPYLRALHRTDPDGTIEKLLQISQQGRGSLMLVDIMANEGLTETADTQIKNALGHAGPSPRRHQAEVSGAFNEQFRELYSRFSQTFIPYGKESIKNSGDLAMLLINAEQGALALPQMRSLPASAWLSLILQRDNSKWDLVDAAQREVLDWDQVDEDTLPPDLQQMNETDRVAYLRNLYAERKDIYDETILMEERWRKERERPLEGTSSVEFGTKDLPDMPIQTPFEGKLPPLTRGLWNTP